MLKSIDKKEVYMKVSSISKSSNINHRAKIRFNQEALEQMSKTSVKDLEKTCKKIGHPQDVILVASKSIESKNLPGFGAGIIKKYVNAISYKIKGESGLAFLKDTTENITAGNARGYSNLSEKINSFLKRF